MGINKFNCEGYYDPTAYEALTRIENEARKLRSFRPVVYICSPLSGDLEGNQEKAARYCRFAVDAVSKGMSIEIEKARRKGQTIRYFTENCQEVSV